MVITCEILQLIINNFLFTSADIHRPSMCYRLDDVCKFRDMIRDRADNLDNDVNEYQRYLSLVEFALNQPEEEERTNVLQQICEDHQQQQ